MNSSRPHVTIRLMGGLGNQLFQYALGRAIEIKCGADVFFDTDPIARKNGRHYVLDKFNTKVALVTKTPSQSVLACFLRTFSGPTYIREKDLEYMPRLFSRIKRGGSFYLDGYWQAVEYFKDIREQLLAEITLKNPSSKPAQVIAKTISSTTSVALHVRRGDYTTSSTLELCSVEYYRISIKTVLEKVPDAHFFVFSDDIDWVRENLNLDPTHVTYVSKNGLSDEEEFMFMSSCAHQIIANSSFSWWAAWLNTNEQKIVIAPRMWFKSFPHVAERLIPSSWIRI